MGHLTTLHLPTLFDFGDVKLGLTRLKVELPQSLQDNARRWRMFYFHYYMAVAMESLFSWLVTNLEGLGMAGLSLDQIVNRLSDKVIKTDIKELLGVKLSQSFGKTTLASCWRTSAWPRQYQPVIKR